MSFIEQSSNFGRGDLRPDPLSEISNILDPSADLPKQEDLQPGTTILRYRNPVILAPHRGFWIERPIGTLPEELSDLPGLLNEDVPCSDIVFAGASRWPRLIAVVMPKDLADFALTKQGVEPGDTVDISNMFALSGIVAMQNCNNGTALRHPDRPAAQAGLWFRSSLEVEHIGVLGENILAKNATKPARPLAINERLQQYLDEGNNSTQLAGRLLTGLAAMLRKQ